MPSSNPNVANKLEQMADLLELQDANPFRVRAYRNAARTVRSLPRRLEEMIADDEDLSELDNIGKDLADKLERLVQSGSLQELDDLKQEVSPGLLEVMQVPTLGPKRTQQLASDLGIKSLDGLLRAAKEHKIRELDGFGEKTETSILEKAKRIRDAPKRFRLAEAHAMIAPLLDYLEEQDGAGEVIVAGSYRRCKETVGDIDILITSNANRNVMDAFVHYGDTEETISHGQTKSSIRLEEGLQVDLRVVPKKSYGAALLYFTGSKAHNIKLRKLAQKRDLKINEYGIFKSGSDSPQAGKTEASMYEALTLDFIPPELREDRGEVDAARDSSLPDLLTYADIRGELHAHTQASDGNETMKDMIAAARERSYEYLAITDHSAHVGVTQGLDKKGVEKQMQEIRSRNDDLKDFTLLAGIEVDILDDGTLALPDPILKELDIVIASVHTRFGLSRKKQTRRILKAMEHECVHVLGHPTGRLLGKREEYDLDLDEIISQAGKGKWALELNCNPLRLDLDDVYCQQAREKGAKIMLGCDAHRQSGLDNLKYGVGQARRGWLESKDVLNTRTWKQLQPLLDRS